MDEENIDTEVDRYIGMAGAGAFLQNGADEDSGTAGAARRSSWGPKFDIRAFHDACWIREGPLPPGCAGNENQRVLARQKADTAARDAQRSH